MKALYEIAPKSIDTSNLTKYTLSIGLRPGGFCFTIYDAEEHNIVGLWHYGANGAEDIDEICRETRLLNHEYGKIRIMIEPEKWTLLPKGFVDKDNATSIWNLNYGEETSIEKLGMSTIEELGMTCLYEKTSGCEEVARKFAKAEIVPEQVALLKRAARISQRQAQTVVVTHVKEKSMDMVVAERGKLKLANRFETNSTSDYLYHTLNAYNIHELAQNKNKLVIGGETSEKDERLKSIRTYVRNVELDNLALDYPHERISQKLANKQEYYNLINTALCE